MGAGPSLQATMKLPPAVATAVACFACAPEVNAIGALNEPPAGRPATLASHDFA